MLGLCEEGLLDHRVVVVLLVHVVVLLHLLVGIFYINLKNLNA
jgi:hypothetical protein